MRVASITGGRSLPSARFRIRQHIEPLRILGIEVRDFPLIVDGLRMPGPLKHLRPRHLAPLTVFPLALNIAGRCRDVLSSRNFDLVWLNKQLIYGVNTLESRISPVKVLDVDDAIWLDCKGVHKTARAMDAVIAGNEFLADWVSRFCRDVFVVPTAIDTDLFSPVEQSRESNRFAIGWTGTTQNQKYLRAIEQPLARFLDDHPKAVLRIVSDQRPRFDGIRSEQMEFIPWSPEVEATALQEISVGLMPLPDSDWARGKCSFKMLQYMATGLASCVSPIGMNKEIARLGTVGLQPKETADWYDALKMLHDHPDLRRRMGKEARTIACKHFSREAVTPRLASLMRSLE